MKLFAYKNLLGYAKHTPKEKSFKREGSAAGFTARAGVVFAYGNPVGSAAEILVVSAFLRVAFYFAVIAGAVFGNAVYTAAFGIVGVAVAQRLVVCVRVGALDAYNGKSAAARAVVFAVGDVA